MAGTLLAIADLHALQSGRCGRMGAAGSFIAFVGYALLFAAAAATTLAGREVLDAVFPVGVLAVFLGSVLLGAATLRARVLPWWCGVLLIVGFPLTVPLDVAVRGAGGIVLGIVWALVGYALLKMGAPRRPANLGEWPELRRTPYRRSWPGSPFPRSERPGAAVR